MSLSFNNKCRICDSKLLIEICDLGSTPLADDFISKIKDEDKYPLVLKFCPNCTLVQLVSIVDAESVFNEEYGFFTSGSPSAVRHFEKYALGLIGMFRLKPDDFIVEIASNDGSFLEPFRRNEFPNILGVEPTANTANFAIERGIPTKIAFWNADTAQEILNEYEKKPYIIIANNVIAHVNNLKSFVEGISILLKHNGTFVFECHHVVNLIHNLQFDNIYHEHLSYFSVHALKFLLEMYGLEIYNIEKNQNHGGSIRVFCSFANVYKIHQNVKDILEEEKVAGIDKIATYVNYQQRVDFVKYNLQKILKDIKSNNQTVYAMGASAKSTTLLNYCGIDNSYIDLVVDKTPTKYGKYTPGTHIPIVEEGSVKDPDYYLLTVWNYADDIIAKNQDFLDKGGRFIIPLPAPKVV